MTPEQLNEAMRLADDIAEATHLSHHTLAEVDHAKAALRAHLESCSVPQIPAGMVLVPLEPTEAMLKSWGRYDEGYSTKADVYRAMIAAAQSGKE